jgi:hypothetical protein
MYSVEKIFKLPDTCMYRTNYMNYHNKYVYVSNKFHRLPKQNISTYRTNYMNCRNKQGRTEVLEGLVQNAQRGLYL